MRLRAKSPSASTSNLKSTSRVSNGNNIAPNSKTNNSNNNNNSRSRAARPIVAQAENIPERAPQTSVSAVAASPSLSYNTLYTPDINLDSLSLHTAPLNASTSTSITPSTTTPIATSIMPDAPFASGTEAAANSSQIAVDATAESSSSRDNRSVNGEVADASHGLLAQAKVANASGNPQHDDVDVKVPIVASATARDSEATAQSEIVDATESNESDAMAVQDFETESPNSGGPEVNEIPLLALSASMHSRDVIEEEPYASTSQQELHQKAFAVANLLRVAKHAVIFTGEGFCRAANIPEYNAINGFWTMRKKDPTMRQMMHSHHSSSAATRSVATRSAMSSAPSTTRDSSADVVVGYPSMQDFEPTYSHLAVQELVHAGFVKHVITSNVDGLHLLAGGASDSDFLCELQGSIYREVCSNCSREYVRHYDVTARTSAHQRFTGRLCEDIACVGQLQDSLVQGDRGDKPCGSTWQTAKDTTHKADLAIVLGSRLSLPLMKSLLEYIANKVHRPDKHVHFVLCNTHPNTSFQDKAQIRVFAECDVFMRLIMRHLNMKVSSWEQRQEQHMEDERSETFRIAAHVTDDDPARGCGCTIQ